MLYCANIVNVTQVYVSLYSSVISETSVCQQSCSKVKMSEYNGLECCIMELVFKATWGCHILPNFLQMQQVGSLIYKTLKTFQTCLTALLLFFFFFLNKNGSIMFHQLHLARSSPFQAIFDAHNEIAAQGQCRVRHFTTTSTHCTTFRPNTCNAGQCQTCVGQLHMRLLL